MKILVISCLVFCCTIFHSSTGLNVEDVYVSEHFHYQITPELFNWTFNDLSEQFTYRASKKGFADLPRWLSYMYSKERHAGFLFGTPPRHLENQMVPIEIIALNTSNYDTKRVTLNLLITPKIQLSRVVQMKIDNLNWIEMMDPGRIKNLKNIFTKDLWPESDDELKVTYMNSAVTLGARRPLNPQEKEGIVVHLGSTAGFSQRLIELQQEVKPLYKISSCAFKRTSVQMLFESSGFKMDWCNFHIVDEDEQSISEKQSDTSMQNDSGQIKRWNVLSKEDIPIRSYSDELAISIAVPGVVLTTLIAFLTVILCFESESLPRDEISEAFFDSIFDICIEYFRAPEKKQASTPAVQMVQYSPSNNQPTTTTLRSLRDVTPTHFIDNISLRSGSPTSSVFIEGSSLPTLRPLPPPYKGRNPNTGSGVQI